MNGERFLGLTKWQFIMVYVIISFLLWGGVVGYVAVTSSESHHSLCAFKTDLVLWAA
jgi:hypothetical protein